MHAQPQQLDAVFEGGGVKGIGLVGALSIVESAGYAIVNVAGTSAGAIVAALVAAGYTAAELKPIIMGLDFTQLTDPTLLNRVPAPVGLVLSEIFEKGLYKGDYFLELMRDLLAAKGKRTFRDFIMPEYADDPRYRFKVRVIASDITRGRMLALPQDIADYGKTPEDLEVALAVRMSMSIPMFFTPVAYRHATGETCYIVDGGLLSNFPVELFDSDGPPAWPTFGFKLVQGEDSNLPTVVRHPVKGPLSELIAMFFTAMEAHDAYYLKAANFVRTITIDTDGIAGTDFTLSQEQKDTLYAAGVAAAQEFLQHWDFERYKAEFRSGQPVPRRRERLMPTSARLQP